MFIIPEQQRSWVGGRSEYLFYNDRKEIVPGTVVQLDFEPDVSRWFFDNKSPSIYYLFFYIDYKLRGLKFHELPVDIN